MISEPEEIELRPDDRAEVVARMTPLARDRNGWVNFLPGIPEGVRVPRQGLLRFFGARGPEALMATWVPGEVSRRGAVGPTKVGIQHPTGRRTVAVLAEAGLPVPEEWRVVQDHSWRGLVLAVPDDADLDVLVDWLLRATRELATFPLTGSWKAMVYSRTS